MVAAHEQHLRNAAPAISDPQREDWPALDAAADLHELSDLRPRFGKLPQLLFHRRRRVILFDRGRRREGGEQAADILELLDLKAHRAQPIQLSRVRAKDQVVGLDLPDIDPERRPEDVSELLVRSRGGHSGEKIHGRLRSLSLGSSVFDAAPSSRTGARIFFQVSRSADAIDLSEPSTLDLGNGSFRCGRHKTIRVPLPDIEAHRALQQIHDASARMWGQADDPAVVFLLDHDRRFLAGRTSARKGR